MKITLAMTVEEYDDYRAYQKDKDILKAQARRDYVELRDRHENLCTSLLNAVKDKQWESHGLPIEPRFEIAQQEHLADAVDSARDWFA